MNDSVLPACRHKPCGKYGTRPLRFSLARVECVQNPWLWKRYCNQKTELREKWQNDKNGGGGLPERLESGRAGQHPFKDMLDEDCNELFLFHGTTSANAGLILHQGFNEKMAEMSGAYGAGSYFTPQVCALPIPIPVIYRDYTV